MSQSIEWLNELSADAAKNEFLKCCGSTPWASAMSAARPFANDDALFAKADAVWWSLSTEDWLEAFRAHPKIGEKKAAAAQAEQAESWSAQEQSGVASAKSQTKDELLQLNREYEDRFGFIFIVCASGKSSEEMLAILNSRIGNDRETELRIAAEEQTKITKLRLRKLLG
ncbi:MAG: 2-oxo-4-hydroxy-4-carboxy-5-ureidoimidazoline decarboxylase [Acidobacteria bacterium]|nr:MAG: 2-oxo-4-hydroxy-4-carboxy-5-ureidoimidazoline decarboxylase [Acidobacteriota bacterium]